MKRKYTYLYVEDDALSREVMQELLENVVGVQRLILFEDSTDFASRVAALDSPPDFIFLDIYVQPLDGYQLLRVLRDQKLCPQAKVIAVTASVMSQEVQQLQARGFDGALAKPLDMATFPELIERLEAGEVIWQVM